MAMKPETCKRLWDCHKTLGKARNPFLMAEVQPLAGQAPASPWQGPVWWQNVTKLCAMWMLSCGSQSPWWAVQPRCGGVSPRGLEVAQPEGSASSVSVLWGRGGGYRNWQ